VAVMRTILIIDDDASSREVVRESLEGKGYEFLEAESGEKAIELFSLHDIDLVTCDILLPGADGIEVLRHIKEIKPDTQVLMLTGLNEVDTAVEAMRLGAADYITKPVRLKELRVVVDRALEQKKLVEEREEWRRQVARYSGRLLGKSPAMQRILHIIEQVAPTRSTVLITGETGTGKDQVAQEIHEQSRRHNKPLIKVDCASLPESLLESELFGHIRGSFTGAIKDRKGRFELADGGSIFLNEIGEMSASAQQRLLRVLQDSELERVGSSATIHLDVRVIAATNKDLQQRISEHKFREDLYYRLRVVQIPICPLRERREDIPILAQAFLKRYSDETGKTLEQFSNDVMDLFFSYSWPGNVRQLKHFCEQLLLNYSYQFSMEVLEALLDELVLIEEEEKQPMSYPEPIHPMDSTLNPSRNGADGKNIIMALERARFNKTKAAAMLGIGRTTLWRKIKSLGLE